MKARSLLAALIGCLTVGLGADPLWSTGFEAGTTEGWSSRGGTEKLILQAGGREGGTSLRVVDRDKTWQGPIRPLAPVLVPGASYQIEGWLRYPAGPSTRTFQMSVETAFKDPQAAHQYKNLASVNAKVGEWTRVQAEYTHPKDATITTVSLYFESAYKADNQVTPEDVVPFEIDDVSVTLLDTKVAIQDDLPRLKDKMGPKLVVGAAITPAMTEASEPRSRLLSRHFSALVAENVMKPEALQPREGTFTFDQADKIAAFAGRIGATLRGHTLVWHSQTPAWFFTDPKDPTKPATKELLLQRLKTHITEVVGHYQGEVDTWDVVNEVVSDRGSGLRTGAEGSRWFAIAGADYIEAAFRAARAADPKAKLAINDYSLEAPGPKQDAMVELVKSLKKKGVPVDVVGLQAHLSVAAPSAEQVRAAIRRFAALGVKVQITELDLSVYNGSGEPTKTISAELLNRQARRYAELFQVFREEAAAGRLTQVVLWGVTDDTSWLNNFPVAGRGDAPLLFDRRLQAKPAFWAIVDPTKVPAATLPTAKTARAARGTPTLGRADEPAWAKAPVITTAVGAEGAKAASAEVRALWDDKALYVRLTVSDPVLDDTSPNVWEQDSVEVFVDENNAKADTYDADDGQYRVNFKNLVSFNGNPAAQKGFRSQARTVAGGYVVEVAVPWTQLKPKAGAIVGFEAQVNDGQGGKRVGIRTFNDGSNTAWQSPLVFGLLVLDK